MALTPTGKPIFNTLNAQDKQSALNRPFEKVSLTGNPIETESLGDVNGRKSAIFHRMIFLEAKVQDNFVNDDGTASAGMVRHALGALAERWRDLYDQGYQFLINPNYVSVAYAKDAGDRREEKEKSEKGAFECPRTGRKLNTTVQFYGNKPTKMLIKGYTGIPEKSAMIQTLIDLGSFGYNWWVDQDNHNLSSFFKSTTGRVRTAGSPFFKRQFNMPIRWRIFHYACDTIDGWNPNKDVKNYGSLWRDIQGGRKRVEMRRFYYGRVVGLTINQNTENSINDYEYTLTVDIDRFDDFLGSGSGNYICGL